MIGETSGCNKSDMRVFNSVIDNEIVAYLQNSGVGLIPTDTTYGLVCSAKDPMAASKLYTLKERTNKPGTLIAASIDQLVDLGLKKRYLKAVEQFWPGPISVIIPSPGSLNYLSVNEQSIAVRIPVVVNLTNLLLKVGPLLTSSANITGQPIVKDIKEAKSIFSGRLDFYVDDVNYTNNQPSAIIKIIDDVIEVIRPGYGFK